MLNILIFLTLLYLAFVASYVLWLHLDKKEKSIQSDKPVPEPSDKKNEGIIGKSKFSLPQSTTVVPFGVKPEPLGATTEETEQEEKNADNFVSSKPVEEIPVEENESDNPEEDNLLPIEIYLDVEDEEQDEEEVEEIESEEVSGLQGASLAGGLTFEDMSSAARVVIHREEATTEECLKAGKTLFELQDTEFFEKLAESAPEGRDIVSELMDFHLAEYTKNITDKGKSRHNRTEIPAGFDINDLVEQLKE